MTRHKGVVTPPDLWVERIQEAGSYQADVIIEDGCDDARWCTITVAALKRLIGIVQAEVASEQPDR